MNAPFEKVIDALPSAVIIIDETGTIQKINSSAEKMFGQSPDDIQGRNVHILMPEAYRTLHDQAINNYIKTSRPQVIGTGREVEALRRDGSTFPIHLSVGEFRTGDKHYFIAIIEDLTQSNQLLKDLALSRERSSLAQKFAQIGMWDWTIATGDLYWSERIAPLFGHEYGALETSYENFLNAIHPEDRNEVTDAVNACVEKGKKYYIEHRVLWPDGTIRWLLERGDVIRDADGKPIRMLGIVQDITERKELEQEIIKAKEEAERAAHVKSIFLANMSHEIRTPMNAVVGLTDVVLETELTQEQREHLTTVRSSANALLALLNDILDISKLESGKLTLEKTIFHLPRTLKDVLQTFAITAREKALDLNLHIHPDMFHCLQGDPTRLRQILINLVGNSVKFTDRGSVTVMVEPKEEGMYHFSVKDTGIGMSKEQINTIFESFIQGDQSTVRRYGGTGLGTTISKQLVELMGGRIWVESEMDHGTTFHFTVRIGKPKCADNCDENCPAHARPDEIARPASRRRFKVLLVEDIVANVTLTTFRLEQQGHTLQVAWNGLQAVEAVQKEQFDIILMDVQMPEMDGMEATRRIRAMKATKEIPIIAMTASVMHEDLELCRQAGMNEIVPKPIDFAQLFATMEKVAPPTVGEVITDISIDLRPPAAKTLPELDGINVSKGLRTWQNPEKYARSLQEFADDFSQAADSLTTMIEEEKLDQAYRLTHTIKGVAGNLAIEQVSSLSEQLGIALRNKQFNEVQLRLPLLAEALQTATASIRQIDFKSPQEPAPEQLPADPEQITQLCQELLTELDKDNPEAAEPVLAKLARHLTHEQLLPIRKHLDNFDFKGAKKATMVLGDQFTSQQGAKS